MKDTRRVDLPRRKIPGLKSRVPRPFDKWLTEAFLHPKWKDHRPPIPWLIVIRSIAKEHGCRIVYDTSRHWRESTYLRNFRDHGPAILVGGAGEPIDVCSALLHELGHHILTVRGQHSSQAIPREVAAWEIAHELAAKYRLPLNPSVRRTGLHSYRETDRQVPGSKARTRRHPAPHSWQLETSRRSAAISTGTGFFSMGKKGKRHAKKFIKKATVRAERRKSGGGENGEENM